MSTISVTLSAVVAFALLTVTADVARAAPGEWNMSANGCHMEPASESIGAIDPANGIVFFSGSNTGTIKLVCPVLIAGGLTIDRLGITYLENDTSGGCTAQIQASIRRVTFHPTYVGTETLGTVTSSVENAFDSDEVSFTTHTVSSNHYYYVYVTVDRNTATNCAPWVYGVYHYDQQ